MLNDILNELHFYKINFYQITFLENIFTVFSIQLKITSASYNLYPILYIIWLLNDSGRCKSTLLNLIKRSKKLTHPIARMLNDHPQECM